MDKVYNEASSIENYLLAYMKQQPEPRKCQYKLKPPISTEIVLNFSKLGLSYNLLGVLQKLVNNSSNSVIVHYSKDYTLAVTQGFIILRRSCSFTQSS